VAERGSSEKRCLQLGRKNAEEEENPGGFSKKLKEGGSW